MKTLTPCSVRVFYLSNLKILRTVREKNGMEKTDESDARILSLIPADEFKQCTLDYLRLKELLIKYNKLKKRVQKLRQWGDEFPINSAKDYIKECEYEIEKIGQEAHQIAIETLPLYQPMIEFLEMSKSIDVVGLLITIPHIRGLENYEGIRDTLASKR